MQNCQITVVVYNLLGMGIRFAITFALMITNFNIDLSGATFEFFTMNRINLQLFQVYVLHEGRKHRFHMQLSEADTFYIANKQVCPEIYHNLESTFSDAILKLGKV